MYWLFDADASVVTADGILSGPLSGSARIVSAAGGVTAIFEMPASSSKDELRNLLHTPAAAENDHEGFVDFDMTHYFAWPSEQHVGSEGGFSIVVAPPPACDLEECDVRFTLAEGRVPATAAPR